MDKYEFLDELKDNISAMFVDVDFTAELKQKYEENFGKLDPEFTLDDLNDAFADLSEEACDELADNLAESIWQWLEGITTKITYPEDAPGQLHLFEDDDRPTK